MSVTSETRRIEFPKRAYKEAEKYAEAKGLPVSRVFGESLKLALVTDTINDSGEHLIVKAKGDNQQIRVDLTDKSRHAIDRIVNPNRPRWQRFLDEQGIEFFGFTIGLTYATDESLIKRISDISVKLKLPPAYTTRNAYLLGLTLLQAMEHPNIGVYHRSKTGLRKIVSETS